MACAPSGLDTAEELAKIVAATADEAGEPAADLSLCVRLRVSSEYSELSLASKFGIDLADAAPLLQATRQVADCLGICFHVGSQAMTPFAYVQALERVRAAIVDASVTVDIVDVGGGFPSIYPGMEPPPLEDYFAVIHRAAKSLPVSYSSELWCEPGRALCAEYNSLIVRVDKVRGEDSLHQRRRLWRALRCGPCRLAFPRCAAWRQEGTVEGFSFYGPTCDDADYMEGPFPLPADVKAGDYIEMGVLGAYGAAMRTAFNGFGQGAAIEVTDEPMASLYRGDRRDPRVSENVVSLRLTHAGRRAIACRPYAPSHSCQFANAVLRFGRQRGFRERRPADGDCCPF